jgi:uncharacterized membrane protein YidH (DUF202 family)
MGVGYALLAVAVLIVGAVRQHRAARALRRGSYDELSTSLVIWLTAAALSLSVCIVILVAIKL